jgi:hypothetical protein
LCHASQRDLGILLRHFFFHGGIVVFRAEFHQILDAFGQCPAGQDGVKTNPILPEFQRARCSTGSDSAKVV